MSLTNVHVQASPKKTQGKTIGELRKENGKFVLTTYDYCTLAVIERARVSEKRQVDLEALLGKETHVLWLDSGAHISFGRIATGICTAINDIRIPEGTDRYLKKIVVQTGEFTVRDIACNSDPKERRQVQQLLERLYFRNILYKILGEGDCCYARTYPSK